MPVMRRSRLARGFARLVVAAALPFAAPVAAASLTIDGVTFTEVSDNVRIVNVTGRGTIDDPFVLVEEIVAAGDAIIGIRVNSVEFGSRVGTFHFVGFALTKVVTNRTQSAWNFFNMELETKVGQASDYYDGLSFAQEAKANRPFRSDTFARVDDILEPRDALRFSAGRVEPNETAAFRFAITHTGPTPTFFLVQHERKPVANLQGSRLTMRLEPIRIRPRLRPAAYSPLDDELDPSHALTRPPIKHTSVGGRVGAWDGSSPGPSGRRKSSGAPAQARTDRSAAASATTNGVRAIED